MSTPEPPVSPEITSTSSSPSDTLRVISVLQLVALIGMAVLIAATYNSIRVGILKLETAVRIQRRALSERPTPSVVGGTSDNGQPTTQEPTSDTSSHTPYTDFFNLG